MTDMKTKKIAMHKLITKELIDNTDLDVMELTRDELKRRINQYVLDKDLMVIGKIQFREYRLKKNPEYNPDMVYSPFYVETDGHNGEWDLWRVDAFAEAVPA